MDLIGRKIFQHLAHSAGPADFKLFHGFECADPEMRSRISRSSVARARRDNVILAVAILGGYLELRSDSHVVALRSHQLERYPMIGVRGHIAKNPGFSIQRGNNKMDVSVVE